MWQHFKGLKDRLNAKEIMSFHEKTRKYQHLDRVRCITRIAKNRESTDKLQDIATTSTHNPIV